MQQACREAADLSFLPSCGWKYTSGRFAACLPTLPSLCLCSIASDLLVDYPIWHKRCLAGRTLAACSRTGRRRMPTLCVCSACGTAACWFSHTMPLVCIHQPKDASRHATLDCMCFTYTGTQQCSTLCLVLRTRFSTLASEAGMPASSTKALKSCTTAISSKQQRAVNGVLAAAGPRHASAASFSASLMCRAFCACAFLLLESSLTCIIRFPLSDFLRSAAAGQPGCCLHKACLCLCLNISGVQVKADKPAWWLGVISGALLRTLGSVAARSTEYLAFLQKGQLPPAQLTLTCLDASLVLEGGPCCVVKLANVQAGRRAVLDSPSKI